MTAINPLWIAQRYGQDWRDEDVLAATGWLTSFVEASVWSQRMERVRQTFSAGKKKWAMGEHSPLYDPNDVIAWYVFQANAYAENREDWFEPEAFRISPVFRRLGEILCDLRAVTGVEERVYKLMNANKGQADDGLYELLVAGAYKSRLWKSVEFVQEQPGIAKTSDLMVKSGRRRWAVECKRVNRSGYEAAEYQHGLRLASALHHLCNMRKCSLIVEVIYFVELSEISANYLAVRAERFLNDPSLHTWSDAFGRGQVRHVDWRLARAVLHYDYVFYGSSRMVELLAGEYRSNFDHSMAAEWLPAPLRPLHATAINRASVVSWRSASEEAARRKARHFKSLVAKAEEQLPKDCPGVIHVGYEARDGNSVDALRHHLNDVEMRKFSPSASQLRWVYGNYLSPEHTNNPNESCALSETTATYKIGNHRIQPPLPGHILFSAGQGRLGVHW